MSDSDEFEFESDPDYDSDPGGDEDEIAIENAFYEADDCKLKEPVRALGLFHSVVSLVDKRDKGGQYKFKALQ